LLLITSITINITSIAINIGQYFAQQKLLAPKTELVNSQRKSEQKLSAIQAERAEQAKQFIQSEHEREIKLEREREELLRDAVATSTPDPEKLERERIRGNEIRQKYWEQRDRQKALDP
jgi:hypothetical protein